MVRPITLKHKKLTGVPGICAGIVETAAFRNTITALIILNAVTLGMETDPGLRARFGDVFHLFDVSILSIFIVELALKFTAYRLQFFRSGWNIFDLLIVLISLAPHTGGLTILRTLRVFRLFRLFSLVPQMRSVISALLQAIPGMASIIAILVLMLYIAAVLAAQTFGQHPDEAMQVYFGSISRSMYTMFQLMTLEGWRDVADETMEFFPWAWVFFIPFIVITTFAILNLFIGIIVDALNIVKEQDRGENEASISQKLDKLNREIAALRKLIEKKGKP